MQPTKYERNVRDTDAFLGIEDGKKDGFKGKNDKFDGPPFPAIVAMAMWEEHIADGQKSIYSYSPSSWADLVMHVVFWGFAFAMEVIVFTDVDKMAHPSDSSVTANKVPFVYAAASLSLMTISTAFLLLIIMFHTCCNRAIKNQVDSYIITIIVAGVKCSLVFLLLITLFATSFTTATDEWRMRTILSIIAKVFLIQQLTNNLRQIGSANDSLKIKDMIKR